MPLVYRIQKKQFVDSVLTGEGARLNGGRWNPPGTPLLYTSTTPELALLETLVHLDGTPIRDLPPFVRISIEVPDAIEELLIAELPTGWNALKYPETLPFHLLPKLSSGYPALGFSLPSVVVKDSPSRNVLINPLHPLMSQVKIVDVLAHAFDERLHK
ncbi:RES domain-containing protein [Fibrisoma montanum]|uniref:RES domain-containing protein n=1 Tax=Fibrisoma montanum TaxID=2305895 RepID=A0A418LZ62_9BACT|nr:RES family NAD+ phosphorylase [Fibrisoma montanum]RIV18638.1 RES domain-containing protein [Fibrisoma montanum]